MQRAPAHSPHFIQKIQKSEMGKVCWETLYILAKQTIFFRNILPLKTGPESKIYRVNQLTFPILQR